MSVLDLSNYDYDDAIARGMTIPGLMRCLKGSGVTRIIVNCWDYQKSYELLLEGRRAGLLAEDVYCFLYYGLPHERREVENAIRLHQALELKAAWLDCEAHWRPDTPTEAQGTTVGYRIATTAQCRLDIIKASMSPGIYTGGPWWKSNMGNFSGFADAGDPLWLAYYPADGHPVHDLAEDYTAIGGPFGGWELAMIHQFSSTIPVCGRNRDHNYWFIQEDAMTPEEKQRLEQLEARQARTDRILAGYGEFPVIAKDSNVAALRIATGGTVEVGDLVKLTGEETIVYQDKQQGNAFLGLLQLQAKFGQMSAAIENVVQTYDNDPVAGRVVSELASQFLELGAAFQQLEHELASKGAPEPGEGK